MGNRSAAQWCQQNGVTLTRAQVEGINEKGGFLVPEEFGTGYRAADGEVRRASSECSHRSDGQRSRTDPVINGELDSDFVGEMTDPDDQDLDYGMISYTAKKHMVLVPYSSESQRIRRSASVIISRSRCKGLCEKRRSLRLQRRCDLDLWRNGRDPNLRKSRQRHDREYSIPSGRQRQCLQRARPGRLRGVVGRLPDYADVGNAKWFVSRKFYFNVMTKLLLSAAGVTATEIEDARNRKFLGYPVVFSQVMPRPKRIARFVQSSEISRRVPAWPTDERSRSRSTIRSCSERMHCCLELHHDSTSTSQLRRG
jgi:hypothetical protein